MLSRKEHSTQGQKLPTQFEEKIQGLLMANYQDKYNGESHTFEVHGFTYPTEVVLMASLVNINDEMLAPVTYHVSADLEESTKMDQLLDTLVDSIGVFFDQYFAEPGWNDFQTSWQDFNFKNTDLYYKATRENVGISLQADLLLREDGDGEVH